MAGDSHMLTRRQAALAMAAMPMLGGATRYPLPTSPRIGVQIFPFIADVQRDLKDTLRQIAGIGVKHIELLAGLGQPAAMAAGLHANGLRSPCVHASATTLFPGVPSLASDLDRVIAYCKAVGAQTLVCSTPWFKAPPGDRALDRVLANFRQEDWLAHGRFLVGMAAAARAAGLAFAYHNHSAEFRPVGTTTGFDIILAATAGRDVAIELDCGWAYVAGADPAELIRRHAESIRFLHLKDVTGGAQAARHDEVKTVPLGKGVIDWREVLGAARSARVSYAFIEQEPPFQRPPLIDARESLGYLGRLRSVS